MTQHELDNYLDAVRSALGDHPEKEEIIRELRVHIWDYANDLSLQGSIGIDEAFSIAISAMEEPASLAASFMVDSQDSPSGLLEAKSVLPENKLSSREFLYLGAIGFLSAIVILFLLAFISGVTGLDLGPLNYIVYLFQLVLVIGLVLGFLYYRDEREFNHQLEKLHTKFSSIEQTMQDKEKRKSFERAFSSHFEGLFELIFVILFLIGILYASFVSRWTLFTTAWYDFMLYVMLFIGGIEILTSALKLFVGEIRISRLIYGISGIFSLFSTILLIIFYPFDLTGWFATFSNPTAKGIADLVLMTYSDPDSSLRTFFGFVAIFQVMNAVYDLVKFGSWKSSDQRSLTVRTGNST